MSLKTPRTAVVIIPPHAVWRPIQVIRARHDRHVTRWMPHITVAYPFRPKEEFDALAPRLSEGLREVKPFTITLERFFFFDHERSYTLWLDPQPHEPLHALQRALVRVLPDCNDVAAYEFGFTPHLSVGQVRGEEPMTRLRAALQNDWKPLTFSVADLALVWRNDPPDDLFRIGATVRLGG